MSSVYKYSQKAFTGRLLLKDVIATGDNGKSFVGQTITIAGWIKTVRQQGKGAFAFLNINDGSHADGIQVIVDEAVYAHKALSSGASIALKGTVVDSIGEGQNVELKATEVLYVGECDAGTYPLAPKAHTLEYLRSIAHFRSRSGLFSSVFRVRNALAYATHKFYQERDFLYVHSPIITASDCEGAGEMFQVTSLLPSASTVITDSEGPDVASIEAAKKEVEENGNAVRTLKEQKAGKSSIKKAVDTLNESKNKLAALEAVPTKVGGLPQTTDKKIDYSRDFFGSPTYLTVSGQLQAEIFACSMSNVYTFGPTFRAEESRTTRHLAEFWMIEPEIAFANLEDLMQLAEDYVRYCCQYVLDNNKQDLELIDNWYAAKAQRDAKVQKKGIENNTRIFTETAVVRMQKIASSEFARITYTDAVKLLVETGKFPEVEWGIDLSSIHERYLAEEIFKGPTIVYNYPKGIKAFYMRQNEDGKTVAAMDLLCPQIGELIGGSQREERHDVLSARLKELSLHEQDFWWYMDLRKYGSIPHSGFGLGFERLIMFATGMENIRDVIPFPRYPDSCQF